MKFGSVGFPALLCILAVSMLGREPGESFHSSFHVMGKYFAFAIDDNVLDSGPAWPHPETDAPPLPLAKAVAIAKRELAKYTDDPSKWKLDTVELRSLGEHARWFYVIEWKPSRPDYIGDGIYIPVLMTGEAVNVKFEAEPDLPAVESVYH